MTESETVSLKTKENIKDILDRCYEELQDLQDYTLGNVNCHYIGDIKVIVKAAINHLDDDPYPKII